MAPISSHMAETLNLPLALQLLNNGCVCADNIVCAAQNTDIYGKMCQFLS